MPKWDEFSAHAVVREIIAQDPRLMTAVVSGITAGHTDALNRLRDELMWSNMAMDAALMLATKRATPGNVDLLNKAIAKRIEKFGSNLTGAERDFLSALTHRGIDA